MLLLDDPIPVPTGPAAASNAWEVWFGSGMALLACHYCEPGSEGLLVSLCSSVRVDQNITLRLVVVGLEHSSATLRFTVQWRERMPDSVSHRVGLACLPQDLPALRRLLAIARGTPGATTQREPQRIPVHIPVEVLGDDGKMHHGSTLDISEGGARLEVSCPLDVGTALMLRLKPRFADDRPRIPAQVVWRGPGGGMTVGVRFLPRNDGERRHLRELTLMARSPLSEA
ncbi:MAG: PilZ domain-containing protein [Myxococcota bacterium]